MIDEGSPMAKVLMLVSCHNIIIGYYFNKAPQSVYVGFPHFGPFSIDVPLVRTLAKGWSWEMVVIRASSALNPHRLPFVWACFCGLIIPQGSVFLPHLLGKVLAPDHFSNPISYSTINGFPALTWLIYHLLRWLVTVTSLSDLTAVWARPDLNLNIYSLGVTLGVLPFVCLTAYKMGSLFLGWKAPFDFSANGKTFFGLYAMFVPLHIYMLYAGWELADAHKVLFACNSAVTVFWTLCMGGVDMWVESVVGYPARTIAFVPTCAVAHACFFLQWALDPKDYINRLNFFIFYCPLMDNILWWGRIGCRQDWGTQLPIRHTYWMHAQLTLVEMYRFGLDIKEVGLVEIGKAVFKDCPVHFTPSQLVVLVIICTLQLSAPTAERRWAIYSATGPLIWCGLL